MSLTIVLAWGGSNQPRFVRLFLFVAVQLFNYAFLLLQIAYRTASNKFPGKLSELFLVLSDDTPPFEDDRAEFQTQGRGRKHQRDDDQMSVESGSKRQDVSSSAEKNRGRGGKSQGRGGKGQGHGTRGK